MFVRHFWSAVPSHTCAIGPFVSGLARSDVHSCASSACRMSSVRSIRHRYTFCAHSSRPCAASIDSESAHRATGPSASRASENDRGIGASDCSAARRSSRWKPWRSGLRMQRRAGKKN